MPLDPDTIAKKYGATLVATPPAIASGPAGVEGDVIAAANKHGVDPHLARAVAKNESGFKPEATSPVGAQGVMQLMPGTAKDMGVTNPLDPTQSIEGGVKYLRQLQDKYPGDFAKQAQAYHQGPGAVDRGVAPGPETQKYVARVMKDREAFASNGGNTGLDPDAIAAKYGAKPIYISQQAPPPGGYKRVIVPPGLQGKPSGATGGILDPPSESEYRMMSAIAPGAYWASKYAAPAFQDIGSGIEGLKDPSLERKAHATHQIFSGGARLAAPLALPAAVAAPGAMALSGALGYGAQQGVDKLAEKASVPQGYREMAGDAAALIGGGLPSALKAGSGLAGKAIRYGIGRIPYAGKPLVAILDAANANKAAVEAAAAKAAAAQTKQSNTTIPYEPVRPGQQTKLNMAKSGGPPAPFDEGASRLGPRKPYAGPPDEPPPPGTTPYQPVKPNPRIAAKSRYGGPTKPNYGPTKPSGPRNPLQDLAEPPPVEAAVEETIKHEPYKPNPNIKRLTRYGGGTPAFDEGASGLGARKPFVPKPPPPKGVTTTQAETITPEPGVSDPLEGQHTMSKAEVQAHANSRGIDFDQAAQELSRQGVKITWNKPTGNFTKSGKPIKRQALGGVTVPDEPMHFKSGGVVVPEEPQDWSKYNFNRIISSPETSQYAKSIAGAIGSTVAKRTRQLSADPRTFLNFVKTELGTHDPKESVAWVLPTTNANVLAQWVQNGARNNLDLGSKKAHTSGVSRLSKVDGRVILDQGKGPGVYIITEN